MHFWHLVFLVLVTLQNLGSQVNVVANEEQPIEDVCASNDVACIQDYLASAGNGHRALRNEIRKLDVPTQCQDKDVALLLFNCVSGPWGQAVRLKNEIDEVFGSHSCIEITDAFTPTKSDLSAYDIIIVEGSDDDWEQIQEWLVTTGSDDLEDLANAGASIFINAAPTDGQEAPTGLPFGLSLTWDTDGNSDVPQATFIDDDLLSGSFQPTTVPIFGNYFALAYIENLLPNTKSLIQGENENNVLVDLLVQVESTAGSTVLFGGMSTTNFHDPQTEASNVRKNALELLCTPSPTICSTELVNFHLWNADKDEFIQVINDGDEICFPTFEVSYEANYGNCIAGDPTNPIKKVVLKHYVDQAFKSDRTEQVPPYYLYGDIDRKPYIHGKKAIRGQNKVTARVYDGSKWLNTETVTFTIKNCP